MKKSKLSREAAHKALSKYERQRREKQAVDLRADGGKAASRSEIERHKQKHTRQPMEEALYKVRMVGTDEGNAWEVREDSTGELLATHASREAAEADQQARWRKYFKTH